MIGLEDRQSLSQDIAIAHCAGARLRLACEMNPLPKQVCKAFGEAGVAYRFLEYGSYFGDWRPRGALKAWTGWPTFPMVFGKGVRAG